MLRLGLLLLYATFMVCCKGNAKSESNSIQTSSIVAPAADTNEQQVPEIAVESTDANDVYICKSAGAKRYHYDESCRGLKRCKHKIEKVSVKTAEGYGLTVCGYEK